MIVAAALAALLAGCSAAVQVDPGTTDLSKMAKTVQAASAVTFYDEPPSGAVVVAQVSAKACQRFQWEPAPTNETALVLLRAEAASKGATGVTRVRYQYENVDTAENCFGTITARGVAIK